MRLSRKGYFFASLITIILALGLIIYLNGSFSKPLSLAAPLSQGFQTTPQMLADGNRPGTSWVYSGDNVYSNNIEGYQIISLKFTGTGLKIRIYSPGNAGVWGLVPTIDGVQSARVSGITNWAWETVNVNTTLPYGTHTIRFRSDSPQPFYISYGDTVNGDWVVEDTTGTGISFSAGDDTGQDYPVWNGTGVAPYMNYEGSTPQVGGNQGWAYALGTPGLNPGSALRFYSNASMIRLYTPGNLNKYILRVDGVDQTPVITPDHRFDLQKNDFVDFPTGISGGAMREIIINWVAGTSNSFQPIFVRAINGSLQTTNLAPRPVYAFFGDSITNNIGGLPEWHQQYPYLVAKKNNASMLNRALGGARAVQEGQSLMDGIYQENLTISKVFYLMGTNDYYRQDVPSFSSISSFSASVTSQLNSFLANTSADIKVIPLVPRVAYLVNPNNTLQDFTNALRNIVTTINNPRLTMYPDSVWNAFNTGTMLFDGEHPNAAGYQYMTSFINVTTTSIPSDSQAPQYSNLIASPASGVNYTESFVIQFNSTWSDSSTMNVGLQFSNVNYSTTNSGSVYMVSLINLSAGSYNYNWWAVDSSGNRNNSLIQNYVVLSSSSSSNSSNSSNSTDTSVTSDTGSGGSSGGGGGGGRSSSRGGGGGGGSVPTSSTTGTTVVQQQGQIYALDFDQFNVGYSNNITAKDGYKINLDSKNYTFVLDSFDTGSAQISLAEGSQVISLKSGEKKMIDSDQDGHDDVVLLYYPTNQTEASLYIRGISKPVSTHSKGFVTVLVVLSLVLVAVIVAITVYFVVKKKRSQPMINI